jgi:hypothetical protein
MHFRHSNSEKFTYNFEGIRRPSELLTLSFLSLKYKKLWLIDFKNQIFYLYPEIDFLAIIWNRNWKKPSQWVLWSNYWIQIRNQKRNGWLIVYTSFPSTIPLIVNYYPTFDLYIYGIKKIFDFWNHCHFFSESKAGFLTHSGLLYNLHMFY